MRPRLQCGGESQRARRNCPAKQASAIESARIKDISSAPEDGPPRGVGNERQPEFIGDIYGVLSRNQLPETLFDFTQLTASNDY